MTDAITHANSYSDPNGLAALKRDPNSPQALRAVAQQVDALFLQMMLKSMREASATGESDSNELGMYQDLFDKQIALNLSQHQGLGLGDTVLRQLSAASPGSPANATPTPAPSGTAAAPASSTLAQTAGKFVAQVLPSIRAAAHSLGLNPLAMLAQTALETGWGTRMARTADGRPSLNLFGIKADEAWGGARATANTLEYSGGVATQRRAVFRAYGTIDESVRDFANLLKTSARYAEPAAAGHDAQAYLNRIGRSGYATDPAYAAKLNGILQGSALRAALSGTPL